MIIKLEELLSNRLFLGKDILSGSEFLGRTVSSVLSEDSREGNLGYGVYLITLDQLVQKQPLDSFFEKLRWMKVAGLLIKQTSDLSEEAGLAVELAELGEVYDLPVISFSSDRNIREVILALTKQINEKYLGLINIQEIYSRFTELSLKNRGLDSVIAYFKELSGNPIAAYDDHYRCLATTEEEFRNYLSDSTDIFNGSTKDNLENLFYYKHRIGPVNGDDKYGSRQKIIFPITFEDRIRGYLILFETERILDRMDYLILEIAATFTLIEIKKHLERKTAGERFVNSIIYDLISEKVDNYGIINERANLIGLNLKNKHRVVLFAIDNSERNLESDMEFQNYQDHIYSIIEKNIHEVKPASIVGRLSNFSIVLWPVSSMKNDEQEYHRIKAAGRTIQRRVKDLFPDQDITIGIGELANNVEEIARSFEEANGIIKLGAIFGKDMISGIKDLGIFKLLFGIVDRKILLEIIPPALFELMKYDEANNTELMKTLKIYLNNNYNAVKTAKDLFIHYKTILYRLNRINEIAGIDLDDYNRRLELEIGIKLLDFFEMEK